MNNPTERIEGQLYVKIVPDNEPNADGEWHLVRDVILATAVANEHDFEQKTKLLADEFSIGSEPQRAGVGHPIRMVRKKYHVVAERRGRP